MTKGRSLSLGKFSGANSNSISCLFTIYIFYLARISRINTAFYSCTAAVSLLIKPCSSVPKYFLNPLESNFNFILFGAEGDSDVALAVGAEDEAWGDEDTGLVQDFLS